MLYVESHVKCVPVADVPRLRALEWVPVLVEDEALFDEECHARVEPEQLGLQSTCVVGRQRSVADGGDAAHALQRLVERLVDQVAVQQARDGQGENGAFKGDGHRVRQPHPCDGHDLRALIKPKSGKFRVPAFSDLAGHDPGGGTLALCSHLLAEPDQTVGAAVGGRRGHEGASSGLTVDEAVGDQSHDGCTSRHATDLELLGKLSLGGQGVMRLEIGDASPQSLLDRVVAGREIRVGVIGHASSLYSYPDRLPMLDSARQPLPRGLGVAGMARRAGAPDGARLILIGALDTCMPSAYNSGPAWIVCPNPGGFSASCCLRAPRRAALQTLRSRRPEQLIPASSGPRECPETPRRSARSSLMPRPSGEARLAGRPRPKGVRFRCMPTR